MKSTIEEKGPWQKSIVVTLDAAEVDAAMNQVVARYRERAALPGFRKGKVPNDVVRATFGGSIEQELLNELLPEALEEVIRQSELRLAAPPTVKDLQFKPGEPLSFTAEVDLWPEVEPKGYQGLEFEEETEEIDDAAIQDFLAHLQSRMTTGNPVARPSHPGDVLDVVLQAVDKNGNRLPNSKREEVRMDAGGARLLEAFRNATVGVRPGESPIVHVQYPDDFEDPNLAGRQRYFRMKVTRVLERQIPPIDDAFAQKVDGSPNLEALRAKIRLRLETEEKVRSRNGLEEAVVQRLVQANPFDISPGILGASLKRAMEQARKDSPGMPEDELRKALAPMIDLRWRRDILLDAIARKETISVSDDDLKERLRELLQGERDQATTLRKWEREGRLPAIRDRLLEQKVFQFVLDAGKVHRIVKPRAQAESSIITP